MNDTQSMAGGESTSREELPSVPVSAPWAAPSTGDFEYTIARQEGDPPLPCDGCRSPRGPWYLAFYYGSVAQFERNEAPLIYVMCSGCATRISKMVDICTSCISDPEDERICDTCGKQYRRKAPGWKPPVGEAVPA